MLYRRRGQGFANGIQHDFAFVAFVVHYFNLDEFMRFEGGGDFFGNGGAQTGIAYHHDRVKMVGLGAQEAYLDRVQLFHGGSLIDEAH